MGEVKESVKGSGPTPSKKKGKKTETAKNFIETLQLLEDDISDCIEIKDSDVDKEGEGQKAENMRKAAYLRAANSLVRSAKAILEAY